ncbi:MAG: biotin--protein ligase [Candidatus Micrarchaeota archaeon]|nr:biotin--protein ligase [Candidatus Micrarchaeota archaeon]
MIGLAKQKVPNGKLLIVKLEHEDGKITCVELLGDFFLYPEETVYKIEGAIKGMDVNTSETDIISKVKAIAEAEKATMLGITPEAIAQTVKAAVKQ